MRCDFVVFSRIRKITPSGAVSTVCGSGSDAFVEGVGTSASIRYPTGLVIDPFNTCYVSDSWSRRIVRVALNTGRVSAFVGSGRQATDDGVGTNASFDYPSGLALDPQLNVWAVDYNKHTIRRCSPDGAVLTVVGNNKAGFADGAGTNALFNGPNAVACDADGFVYVADCNNYRVRRIDPTTAVATTYAGTGVMTWKDDVPARSGWTGPFGLGLDSDGRSLFVADSNRLRRIPLEDDLTEVLDGGLGAGANASAGGELGVVVTVAGSDRQDMVNGSGTQACFSGPGLLATDSKNNCYVPEWNNHRIRKITPDGVVTTFAGSTKGYRDGQGTNAQFNCPYGVASDDDDNLYVSDGYNRRVRKITPAGVVSTLVGTGTDALKEGIGAAASIRYPTGLVVDHTGTQLIVSDSWSRKLVRVNLTSGELKIFAGSGRQEWVDSMGTNAGFDYPTALAIDSQNNVFVVDYNQHRIRKVAPNGAVTTFAGTGRKGAIDGSGTNAYVETRWLQEIRLSLTHYVLSVD